MCFRLDIKKIWIGIIMACIILQNVQNVQASVIFDKEETEDSFQEELFSKSAVLMDAESGRVLYGKNADEKLANASTTKIMTLILTLENASLDDVVTVSEYA